MSYTDIKTGPLWLISGSSPVTLPDRERMCEPGCPVTSTSIQHLSLSPSEAPLSPPAKDPVSRGIWGGRRVDLQVSV